MGSGVGTVFAGPPGTRNPPPAASPNPATASPALATASTVLHGGGPIRTATVFAALGSVGGGGGGGIEQARAVAAARLPPRRRPRRKGGGGAAMVVDLVTPEMRASGFGTMQARRAGWGGVGVAIHPRSTPH